MFQNHASFRSKISENHILMLLHKYVELHRTTEAKDTGDVETQRRSDMNLKKCLRSIL